MPYLELQAVSKSYPQSPKHKREKPYFVSVLEDVSLSISQNEKAVFVGPSGCGKSTLLELICNLKTPDTGVVRGPSAVLMPQENSLFPWLNALDNAALALRLAGESRQSAQKKAKNLLTELDLTAALTQKPAELSGGMRQRVAFARTLLTDREVLCLDEPFAALDALSRSALQRWLTTVLKKTPRTMVLVTHDTEEAVLLADRVFVFSAKPSKILGEVHVQLPYPRVATDPEIVKKRAEVLNLLKATSTLEQ